MNGESPRPLIGISGITRAVEGTLRTGINVAYAASVVREGGVPLILSPLIGPENAESALEPLHGLILSGGEDIDPSAYGQARHPQLGKVDSVRDAFELALFRAARERQLPVLAICRGIQLVNVAMGGTLWQDLPSERGGPVAHDPPLARTARSHTIGAVPGSRLAHAVGTSRLTVNSFHHQAIREPANGVIVSARSEDEVIEGIESPPGPWWLVGVQWHPEEFHAEAGGPDHGLFRSLIEEAERFRDASGNGPGSY
jgi:putative glutamine amidotransferase